MVRSIQETKLRCRIIRLSGTIRDCGINKANTFTLWLVLCLSIIIISFYNFRVEQVDQKLDSKDQRKLLRKERVESTWSESVPPADAPSWAVLPSYDQVRISCKLTAKYTLYTHITF